MDAVALPAITFSRWARWSGRASLESIDRPGVYVLAHFSGAPPGAADPLSREVVYVGATDRSLGERWQEFHRVVEGKAKNHAGGVTYRGIYGNRTHDLYVAAFPVPLEKKLSWWFIRYVEAKLQWEFVLKWGSPPPCNRG